MRDMKSGERQTSAVRKSSRQEYEPERARQEGSIDWGCPLMGKKGGTHQGSGYREGGKKEINLNNMRIRVSRNEIGGDAKA